MLVGKLGYKLWPTIVASYLMVPNGGAVNESLREFMDGITGLAMFVALIWVSVWSHPTFSTPGEDSIAGILIFFILVISLVGAMISGGSIVDAEKEKKRRESPGHVGYSYEPQPVSRGRRVRWAVYTGLFLAVPTIIIGSAWADNGRQIRKEIVEIGAPLVLRVMVVGQASSGEIVLMPISENGRYPLGDQGFWLKRSDGCKVPVVASLEVVAPSLRVKNMVLVAVLESSAGYHACVGWPPKVLSVRPLIISQEEIDQVVAERGLKKREK
jgi:hypothetical protein